MNLFKRLEVGVVSVGRSSRLPILTMQPDPKPKRCSLKFDSMGYQPGRGAGF
jgi:hypothetical protein